MNVENAPAQAVEMVDITRRFGRVVANNSVNLSVRSGEVHAIVGENGAGKSTLMHQLYGLQQPDSGIIRIHGQQVRFDSPADAIAAGIGMVHQHFMLVPVFTVTENITLGEEPVRAGFLNHAAAMRSVHELMQKYGMHLDPGAKVGNLTVGQQQRIEILKILYRGANIIILDEPTAVLTPQEVDSFFNTVRELKAAGNTIIIITHKLREVMSLSDRVSVMRAGQNVASLETASTNAEEIARLMVGRSIILPTLRADIAESKSGDLSSTGDKEVSNQTKVPQPALNVVSLSIRGREARPALDNISFQIAPGEILGIAGVEGNGQAELVDTLTGLKMPQEGTIEICGVDVTRLGARAKFRAGLACIPDDRHRKGLVLDLSMRENLLLGRHRERHAKKKFRGERLNSLLEEFDVRPPDGRLRARQLSGGNQQKLIIAREFTRKARVLIANQPTRGIDLGAIEFIHRRMLELREKGMAILLVSAELTEILALSDRVAVMYEGRVVYTAPNQGLTEHDLGVYMGGGAATASAAGANNTL
jgi:simple sugar transport system ATP-binding protein